jgi:serine/threonine-protein kinase RsbW
MQRSPASTRRTPPPAARRWSPPDTARLRLSVRVPGHAASISPLVERILSLLRDTGGLADREFEVETALREALANAIRHGCGNDPAKEVDCSLVCLASHEIRIVVRDPGAGFDPASIPNPTGALNLHSCHGRGIYLIRQLMDDVWFERGGTEIHMRKRLDRPLAPLSG